MPPHVCPPEDVLRRYAGGDLDEPDAESVNTHLADCPACLTRLDRLATDRDSLVAGVRALAGDSFSLPGLERVEPDPPAPMPGSRIADYLLAEEVGSGGMGRVYRAAHPRLDHEVAVKVLRGGADPEVGPRFEAERQTLARMDHPNIARVIDGGTTPEGRPFFVMEYVRGDPLTQYSKDRGLGLRARLELFAQVCAAVQHAHQKGVIHRDLKPSNVLVAEYDGKPVPKVIDFGVAKATSGETMHTEFGMLVGTPEYMSPEQAGLSADDVDTRSDVYALGVILYELLTGDTPVEKKLAREKPVLELLRVIREVEPPAPSTRANEIPRDLDWVCLKALEKDRGRRYDSAAALADDVRRVLANEPVAAAPPSRMYRVHKFVRRNRGLVVAAATIFVALVGGIAGTSWQAVRARDAEADAKAKLIRALTAEGEAKENAEVAVAAEGDTTSYAEFLVDHVLGTARPKGTVNGLGIDVSVARALEAAEPEVAKVFAGRPRAEAEARLAVGVTWHHLGKLPAAERNLKRAVELREKEFGPEATKTVIARIAWANCIRDIGRRSEAVGVIRADIDILSRTIGPDASLTLKARMELANALIMVHDSDGAVREAESAEADASRKLGPNHELTQKSRTVLANAYKKAGRKEDYLRLAQEAVDRFRIELPADDITRLKAEFILAGAYFLNGRADDALVLFDRSIPVFREKFGPGHFDTITSLVVSSSVYVRANRPNDAVRAGEEGLKLAREHLGADHPTTFLALSTLAAVYLTLNRRSDYETTAGQLAKALDAQPDSKADHVLDASADLSGLYAVGNRLPEASRFAERTVADSAGLRPDDHPKVEQALRVLTATYIVSKDWVKCEQLIRRQIAARKFPADSPDLARLRTTLGECLIAAKRPSEAEPPLRAVLAAPLRPPADWQRYNAMSLLGESLAGQKRYDEAEQSLLEGQRGLAERVKAANAPPALKLALSKAAARLVQFYESQGQPEKAAEWRPKPAKKGA